MRKFILMFLVIRATVEDEEHLVTTNLFMVQICVGQKDCNWMCISASSLCNGIPPEDAGVDLLFSLIV